MLQDLYLHSNSHYALVGGAFVAAVLLFVRVSLALQHKDDASKPFSVLDLFPGPVRSRVDAWRFLFQGPAMIQAAYDKVPSLQDSLDAVSVTDLAQSNGAPFRMDMPENSMLIVSDWKRIKEIDAAPEAVLSLQGAAKEILQPMHTMRSFNWMDKRGGDGAPLLKTLRNRLTEHLPNILGKLHGGISTLFDERIAAFPTVDGK